MPNLPKKKQVDFLKNKKILKNLEKGQVHQDPQNLMIKDSTSAQPSAFKCRCHFQKFFW